MIFFKSTRPDGTDFYSGQVDYAAALTSGEPLPELSGGIQFPGLGWYHLSTVPTECVGMTWPCRLFEVEPVGDVIMDNDHPYKIGSRSVRVLREIDAHRVFGPQGEQIAVLIDRCRTLSGAEIDRLAAAWTAAGWDAAWGAARDARRAAWDGARNATWDATRGGFAWRVTWGDARYAAGDAAWGLLCRDLIGQAPGWDQDAYNLLTWPWSDVIGPIHPDDGDEGGLDDD